MSTDGPKRRYELRFRLGADDWATLIREVEDLAIQLEEHDAGHVEITSGGVSAGSRVEVTEQPDQTPERYRDELRAYITHLRAQRRADLQSPTT